MKIISLVLFASVAFASADPPRKQPLNKYQQLWKKSLVTVPPPPPPPEVEVLPSELDDFVLGGWTKTSQGYLVSLINTKDPKENKTIAPGMPNAAGYQVVEVKRDPLDYKATQILIKSGVYQKWIGYEEKYLTLQQPRQPQKPSTQKKPTTTRRTSNNSQQQSSTKQPRVRRVPVPPKK